MYVYKIAFIVALDLRVPSWRRRRSAYTWITYRWIFITAYLHL